jgi:hypothetical protein
MTNPISGAYAAGDAISFKDCFVEVDVNAEADWADIDSWATEIAVSGEDVPTTQTFPFEGNAIVFAGNKNPVTINCTVVYTEGTDDPFHNIRARFEAAPGGAFNIRFAPAGSGAGNKRFTSSGGKLTACPLPTGAGDASSATVSTFTVVADGIAQGVM